MHDEDRLLGTRPNSPLLGIPARRPVANRDLEEGDEQSCPAFGFLRGLQDRAAMVEFRFRNGNTHAFPYSWLGPVQFNPSVGLLLRFTGDVVTLVLVRGSNLDLVVNPGAVNLTDRGLQRHRITFVREMDEVELRGVGEVGPTVDRIEVAEFEIHEDLVKWLNQVAPAFAKGQTAS